MWILYSLMIKIWTLYSHSVTIIINCIVSNLIRRQSKLPSIGNWWVSLSSGKSSSIPNMHRLLFLQACLLFYFHVSNITMSVWLCCFDFASIFKDCYKDETWKVYWQSYPLPWLAMYITEKFHQESPIKAFCFKELKECDVLGNHSSWFPWKNCPTML